MDTISGLEKWLLQMPTLRSVEWHVWLRKMFRFHKLSIVLLPLLLVLVSGLAEAKRIALVIGNATYAKEKALSNPINDADLIARVLSNDLKFDEVIVRKNQSRKEMNRLIDELVGKAKGADAVVVYYSGHGIQHDGQNYLIPVDASIQQESDIDSDGVSSARLLTALEAAAPKMTVVILDACRDNPYSTRTRSANKGLARMGDVSEGMLVAYATRDGSTADDGAGKNSPYAKALADQLRRTDQPVRLAFERVADQVREVTGGSQRPVTYGDLRSTAYLVASPAPSQSLTQVAHNETHQPDGKEQDIFGGVMARLNGYAMPQALLNFFLKDEIARGFIDTDTPENIANWKMLLFRTEAAAQFAANSGLGIYVGYGGATSVEYMRSLYAQHLALANSYIQQYLETHPVSDEQLHVEYDAAVLKGSEAYKFKVIMVKSEAEAMGVINDLEHGKSFDELVRERSIVKLPEGEIKDGSALDPEMLTVLIELKNSGISDRYTKKPLKGSKGYYVVKLESVYKHTMPKFDQWKFAANALVQKHMTESELTRILEKADLQ